MTDMVERVARALMRVNAARPGNQLNGLEIPVLSSDPDFDDLPLNRNEGTEDDDITQEAVLRLARAAIEAMREPTYEMRMSFPPRLGEILTYKDLGDLWKRMVDAALKE